MVQFGNITIKYFMLPEFPQFKPLELGDKEEVEKITGKYPPYSDFNFVSMWSWDIKGEMRISVLNGNLVVLFRDYLSGKPFYSFLGDNKVNETAEALFELSKKEGLEMKMKLLPEDSVKDLDTSKFNVEGDRNNFDYIYKTEDLSMMQGGKFEVKRKHFRFFKKNFVSEIKILDLNNPSLKEEILNLFKDWAADKADASSDHLKQNELSAVSRFLDSTKSINFFVIGIYVEGKLISASITENTHHNYNMGHFQKSRTSFKGLNDYLMNELAKALNERNIEYMNCEQDLGLLGLRESKESYIPCNFLKKFTLSISKDSA